MTTGNRKKNKVSDAQLRAIRANYARIAREKTQNVGLVPVLIKTHRDKNGGHYHLIMGNIDDKHVSVGLSTRQTKGKNGGKNYSMEKSPLDDGKRSYMRRQGLVAPIKEYYGSKKGTLTAKDYDVAKKYSARALEKYLANKA